jgi:hypothetical protein
MRNLKTMFTLLLAIVWLPISSHCLLFEPAANLAILACCDNEATTSHHENACDSDGCAVVEDAQYRSLVQRIAVPTLGMTPVFELPPLLVTTLKSAAIATHQTGDVLARLPVAWQFSFRAAAPPRAPSLVS